jgi:hypothetical protein
MMTEKKVKRFKGALNFRKNAAYPWGCQTKSVPSTRLGDMEGIAVRNQAFFDGKRFTDFRSTEQHDEPKRCTINGHHYRLPSPFSQFNVRGDKDKQWMKKPSEMAAPKVFCVRREMVFSFRGRQIYQQSNSAHRQINRQ